MSDSGFQNRTAQELLSETFTDAAMRMLRERAEDGVIHMSNQGVEAFIEDALQRMFRKYAEGRPSPSGPTQK